MLARGQQTDTTVPVRPGMRLDIDNFGGGISVKTWSQNAVRVQAEHSSRERVEVDASMSSVTVRASSRRGAPSTVDYTITAPAWMELSLHGTYTDIEVDGTQPTGTAATENEEGNGPGGTAQVRLKPEASHATTA